jgi:16S rRNA (guanine966-N2)-methyltransferase
VRVIAGTARGMRIEAPKGVDVRPTLDRVRESLFNILAPRLASASFLDLYAGSGANGIEALSRGAARCTFVDTDRRAIQTVEKNLAHTRLARGGRCMRFELPKGLAHLASCGPFDIIFADPPYKFSDHARLLARVAEAGLLAPEGIIVLEHSSRLDLDAIDVDAYALQRQAKYGGTTLTFFS